MVVRAIRTWVKAEDGAILIFWAITLVLVLGFVALSFDFGQRAATQSELQGFADQVALAAAGELDGKADAITRAEGAAADLIRDSQTFATGTHALSGPSDYSLTFYRSLPSSDTADLSAGATTDPARAAYVRVRVTPRSVPFTFTGAFDVLRGGTTANPNVGAVAVAGFSQYACDITPLMFCVPSPTFKAKDNIGKMILLRSGGNDAAWGPGDFGFLDPAGLQLDPAGNCAGLNGAQMTTCLIAATGALTQCFSQRGVNLEPGQKVGLENSAFNVRFDMWGTLMNSKKNDPIYAPAPNVIKGLMPQGNGCNTTTSTSTRALPRDDCFALGTCANGNRFGNGVWSTGRSTSYVHYNYNDVDPFPAVTTRYNYYKAEIAAAGGGASTTAILPVGKPETGRPQCSSQQSPDPDRRIVVAAGIDCAANSIRGAATNVPVHEFVKLFMTEPVGQAGNNFDLFVEIVDTAESGGSGGAGTGGIFHDVVQLYR